MTVAEAIAGRPIRLSMPSACTTLGIGDLVPRGALRAVTVAEAIAGLVFIAWSASFAFLQMQRAWGDE